MLEFLKITPYKVSFDKKKKFKTSLILTIYFIYCLKFRDYYNI